MLQSLIPVSYTHLNADITFHSEIEIDLGDIHVKGIQIDTPHTRDAVLYYVKEEKIVIAADAEYEDYYDNNSQYDPEPVSYTHLK